MQYKLYFIVKGAWQFHSEYKSEEAAHEFAKNHHLGMEYRISYNEGRKKSIWSSQ